MIIGADATTMLDTNMETAFKHPFLLNIIYAQLGSRVSKVDKKLFEHGAVTLEEGPYPTTRCLVVEGPYRYVRNPSMLTILLHTFVARVVLTRSVGALVYLLIVFIIMTLWFKYVEEPDLKKRFGLRYQVYCDNVPRWMPRMDPFHFSYSEKNPNEPPV
jgi:hypothetical protein